MAFSVISEPLDVGSIVAVQLALGGPIFPEADGVLQGLFGVDGFRKAIKRRPIAEHKGLRLTLSDGELG